MIVMCRTAFVALPRDAAYAINSENPAITAGTSNVPTTNQRVRTRSRYSRFATMRIFLSMARHPGLDAFGTDTLDEDLMERRLHELEAFDVRAGIEQASQQNLWVRRRRELELDVVVVVVH